MVRAGEPASPAGRMGKLAGRSWAHSCLWLMTTIALTSWDRNRTLACNGVLTAVRLKPLPGDDRLIMLPFGMVGFVDVLPGQPPRPLFSVAVTDSTEPGELFRGRAPFTELMLSHMPLGARVEIEVEDASA